jgi:hypothetical protein
MAVEESPTTGETQSTASTKNPILPGGSSLPTTTTTTTASSSGSSLGGATAFGSGVASSGGLITNFGFETGDFTGWLADGARAVLNHFNHGAAELLPPQGSKFALIHTGTGAVAVPAVLQSAVCTPSGLSCTQGSLLRQNVSVASSLVIKFNAVMLTNEFPSFTTGTTFKDVFGVFLQDSAETIHKVFQIVVTNLNSSFVATPAINTDPLTTDPLFGAFPFTLNAGAGQASLGQVSKTLVPASGLATLFFGVADVGDSAFDTGVLIDAVSVELDPPLFFLRDGARLTKLDGAPLLQLTGSPRTFDSLLLVCCDASANFAGPLLRATDSNLDVPFSLVSVIQGGRLVSTSTGPLALLEGGTHSLGALVGVFEISGQNTGLDPATGLTLGTDQPLQHPGPFLEVSAATVTTESVLKVDTALLEASRPLLDLKAGSSLTTAGAAVDLSYKAKVTSLGPLVQLDASRLTVGRGAAVSVAGGSVLGVTGNLIQLNNGSTLSLLNGSVLAVSGGSVVNISGALVGFGGSGGNQLKVTNSLCSPCTLFAGIPVALANGAVASNVSIGPTPIQNAGLGSVTLSNPTLSSGGTAMVVVSGPASKVSVGGK